MDFTKLLQQAVVDAKAMMPQAKTDLYYYVSKVKDAVNDTTANVCKVELLPVEQDVYRLYFKCSNNPNAFFGLGIYVVAMGYPIARWHSLERWQNNPDRWDVLYRTSESLDRHFQNMVSRPSRLVRLVLKYSPVHTHSRNWFWGSSNDQNQ